MLYSLFRFLDSRYDLPGAGMFQYISFRAAIAIVLALLITIFFGRPIIRMLQRHQIGDFGRDRTSFFIASLLKAMSTVSIKSFVFVIIFLLLERELSFCSVGNSLEVTSVAPHYNYRKYNTGERDESGCLCAHNRCKVSVHNNEI